MSLLVGISGRCSSSVAAWLTVQVCWAWCNIGRLLGKVPNGMLMGGSAGTTPGGPWEGGNGRLSGGCWEARWKLVVNFALIHLHINSLA